MDDLELLLWLVEMGRADREQYRLLREFMWQRYVENSARSEFPSKCS